MLGAGGIILTCVSFDWGLMNLALRVNLCVLHEEMLHVSSLSRERGQSA